MTKREILHYLETIQGEITDIQHRADSIGDSENRCSADTVEELINELTNRLEDNQEVPVPHEDMDREGGLMGPDGLPLVHIEPGQYFSGDGEGRLKGNN